MGICEVLSAPRSPWQQAYVERVIGSVRRECLERFNLRKWGPSCWCRRSADCTTATNDGLHERVRIHHVTHYLWPFAIGV
jgi:hypothetical protein